MSQLPYIVILTSSDCKACQALHYSGDFAREGEVNSKVSLGGFQWNANSFWSLITATTKPNLKSKVQFSVLEYELYTMQKTDSTGVKSFTVFFFELQEDDDGKFGIVHRNTYERVSSNSDEFTYTSDDGSEILKEPKKGSFNGLLNKTFPKLLNAYAVQFPSFVYISNAEMNKALKDPAYSPYAKSFSLITGKRGDNWAPVARDSGKEDYKTGFIAYAKYAAENPSFLSPPIETSEVETTATKTVSKSPNNLPIKNVTFTANNPNNSSSSKVDTKTVTSSASNKTVPVTKTSSRLSSKKLDNSSNNTMIMSKGDSNNLCIPYRIKVVSMSSRDPFGYPY